MSSNSKLRLRMAVTEHIEALVDDHGVVGLAELYIICQRKFGIDRLLVDRILEPYFESGQYEKEVGERGSGYVRKAGYSLIAAKAKKEADEILLSKPAKGGD